MNRGLLIPIIVYLAVAGFCLLAFIDLAPQTVIFPKSVQSVVLHWSHDQAGKGTVWYRVVWSTGSIGNIPDTSYVLNHSLTGDSTVIYATAYWRAYPDIESVPSNKVTALFKDAIIPPLPSTYLTLPYIAGRVALHDKAVWKVGGATVPRIGGYIMYGPKSSAGANPGSMWADFNMRESGRYRISVWGFGDMLSINGAMAGFNTRNLTKQDVIQIFVAGTNRLTLRSAYFSIEVDSVRIDRIESIAPPAAPVVNVTRE